MPDPSASFAPFAGQHCETVTTGTLLHSCGVTLSEPLLFGLGEGLGFVMLNLSSLPLPFVGGRSRPFALTTALCRNLGLECAARETSSKATAWKTLTEALDAGRPMGLQLDCYYLPYFSQPVHFAGHFVAAVGYDDAEVRVVDTQPQGTLQHVPRAALEAARFARGPMSAKARAWTIAAPRRPGKLGPAIRAAVRANARAYLAPAFSGASHLGIGKLARSLPGWRRLAKNPARDLALASMLMERAGTGGALFRNFYRDFLREAREHLPAARGVLEQGESSIGEAATHWSRVAKLVARGDDDALGEAGELCHRIASLEVDAMRTLARI